MIIKMLAGGLGFAASASTSESLGLFEPNHSSAPKHAGQDKATPLLLSCRSSSRGNGWAIRLLN
ncbi:MAG: isocitrate/isopropylmalate family dehydrogenase [Candidatus Odinarchaeota archaeon]